MPFSCINNTAPNLRAVMVNPHRFYTYAYLREDRTPYYIGKGSGKRMYHRKGRPCSKPKDKSRIIFLKQNLIEKEAFKHEKYMIAVFGRKDLGTGILHNRTDGGEGVSGFKFNEASKEKMSKSQTGKIIPQEVRDKISKSTIGIPKSEETKKRMSESLKGRIMSDEARKSMSESHKGKTLPKEKKDKISKSLKLLWKKEEFKIKMSDAHKGKKHTEETKSKISKASKGRKHSEETQKKLRESWKNRKVRESNAKKYVFISPDGELFEGTNIRQFCSEKNLNHSTMCSVLRGKRKHHKGWKSCVS